jgi:Rad3-related DNA helicase
MVEGVDLYEDRCRWQVLLKVPFGYLGDSRVDYLVNECHDWQWYSESAALDVQQSVGRAVRGPEPSEASSFYVIDEKFNDLIFNRVDSPGWFTEAVIDKQPEHWDNPQSAPWR